VQGSRVMFYLSGKPENLSDKASERKRRKDKES
jgi:hypothetical protein